MSTREHAQGVVRVPAISKHVLRAWRRSRHWTVPEMARRLARAAQDENVPIARGGHDSLKRMIYQWEDENDKHVPGEHYQLLYVKALGLRSLEDLLVGPPGYTGPAGSSGLSVPSQRPAPVDIENLIMAVAGESADYASSEDGRSVAPLSVVHLTAELQRLARSYSAMPPLEFLGQARKLRDESRRLSERTRKPVQLADLHLVTGGACGLLAMASWDLGAWSAAIEQAHAAGIYGEIVGHRGLQAWAAGCEGLIVFWRGRPREAADVVASALEIAPRGTARARLHCIAARAWAYLGAVDRVRSELAAADRAQDEAGDAYREELHDEIGGEYGWDKARHAMCAATALLIAGDPAGAAVRAREAIALHAAGHAFGDLVSAKARADLACVELSGGGLDAAEDALNPVWGVAPGFRRYPLVGRLESASAALGAPRYARSRPAADLVERIRVFSAESAPALAARGILPPGGQ